jgi:hypothetical protein
MCSCCHNSGEQTFRKEGRYKSVLLTQVTMLHAAAWAVAPPSQTSSSNTTAAHPANITHTTPPNPKAVHTVNFADREIVTIIIKFMPNLATTTVVVPMNPILEVEAVVISNRV